MKRATPHALLLSLAALCSGCLGPGGGPWAGRPVVLTPGDRLLVLAPHPDDDVLGAGGVIQRAVEHGLPVRVVYLSYGDFHEWSFLLERRRPALRPQDVRAMALRRGDEARAAAAELGLGAADLTFLGYPDAGSFAIWTRHWGDGSPAYRSRLTRVRRVPYGTALTPGAPYRGESVLADLRAVLDDFEPTRIFVSHPADAHPDHVALYLFTRVALWQREAPEPSLHPFLVHYPRWPPAGGPDPEVALAAPSGLDEPAWRPFPLTTAEAETKHAALRRHRTQYRTGRRLLVRFVRANELFGDFPTVALPPAAEPVSVEIGDGTPEPFAEWLEEDEPEPWVALRSATVRRAGDRVEIDLDLPRPLVGRQAVTLHFFGFRFDLPFEELPKLRVRVESNRHRVYDRTAGLPATTATVSRRGPRIRIGVPLAALGDPERLLVGGKVGRGAHPRPALPWHVIDLAPRRGDPPRRHGSAADHADVSPDSKPSAKSSGRWVRGPS